MNRRTLISAHIALYIYALGALITFGIAWNVDYEPETKHITAGERNAMRSTMSAMAWPLYLSVKGFAYFRSTQCQNHFSPETHHG